MFEIKNDDSLFRFSFVERMEEPEDRRQDLIICWLEVQGAGISLQCECEFTLFDLEDLRIKLVTFYQALSDNLRSCSVTFSPRINTFSCEFCKAADSDAIGFNFKITPDVMTRWTLEGGMLIDQSYFPGLISGIDAILTN